MIEVFKKLNLNQLKSLARLLARNFAGEKIIIGLCGDLGSGKTTFVKYFAQALGIKNAKSPTFTIINQFRLGRANFYHVDLYRLTAYSQLQALGFREIISEPGAMVLIEWADKFPQIKKLSDLTIKFIPSDKPNLRNVTVIQQ